MKKDIKKQDAIRGFRRFGFEVVKEAEHIKMRNAKGETISLPSHKRIKGSTLSNICRGAGIDKAKFFETV